MMEDRPKTYIAIDLKSFYASVECVERGLDPLTARLVVADTSRTDATICLAVSPALKAYGIGGRARLFEVKERLRQIEQQTGEKIDFIAAPPRMALYLQYSHRIVDIYRQYVSDDDLHVYSVDEVMIDITPYMGTCYKMTPHELTIMMIREVLRQTGITATAGIGTNLYLAKVAMDIVAKHIPADEDGVRIAELDEMGYRQLLWNHKPLRSFWRVGRGIAARLEDAGIDTMGKLARLSLLNGEWLYRQFGIQAELLIDHAWGYEPCTMAAIKAYRPSTHSLSRGQVLFAPYPHEKALTVIREMADSIALELFSKRLMTNQLAISIHYDKTTPAPSVSGQVSLPQYTSSGQEIIRQTARLFEQLNNPALRVRRLNIALMNVLPEREVHRRAQAPRQLSLFDNEPIPTPTDTSSPEQREREQKLQQAVVDIKRKYGKNVLLKGLNFNEGATGRERNQQIGGHKA